VIITQDDNPFGASSDSKNIVISNTENDRIYFDKNSRRIIDFFLEKNTIIRSFDHVFGTSIFYNDIYVIFKKVYKNLYNSVYDTENPYNGLCVITFYQAGTSINSTIVPSNLVGILSLLGGFLTLITKLTGWCLLSYQRFTFRKSKIKKLYYYSRTKKKSNHKHSHEHEEDCKSNQTMMLSEQSDFEEEVNPTVSHMLSELEEGGS
jgi:hypothetical protein